MALGDADGDGKLDLLSNGAAGRYTYWFKGNGDGTFAAGLGSSTGRSAVIDSALGVVASDFNGTASSTSTSCGPRRTAA